MTVDYTAWRFWMDVGIYAFNIALGLYVWWDKRKVKTAKRFQVLEQWQTAQEARLATVEQGLENAEKELQDTKESCKAHHARTDSIDKRSLQMAADYDHLPTKEELEKLSEKIGALTEKLGRLEGRLSGVGRAVDLMNQHLLKVGG